jgi:hypothetical protein
VPPPNLVAHTRVVEVFERVLADGLEQPVARGAIGLFLGNHQRLVDELPETVDHIELGSGVDRHRLRRVQGEPAREHAQAVEQCLLVGVEQCVRPVNRGSECLVTLHRRARPAGEETESLVDASRDLTRRHHAGAGGGQLDRERDAVEAAADLRDGGHVLVGRSEATARVPRPVHEELHGVARKERGRVRIVVVDVERSHHEEAFTAHAESFATGREHAHRRAGSEDRVDEPRRRHDQVLAVVEHEQELAVA